MRFRWLITALLLNMALLAQAQPQGPDTLWSRIYTEPHSPNPGGLAILPSGQIIISGHWGTWGNEDLFLLLLDSLGQSLSLHTYGNPNDHDGYGFLCRATDGGFAVAGTYADQGNFLMVLRVNADGDTLWRRLYAHWQNPELNSICPAGDGGFMLATTVTTPDSRGISMWMHISDEGDSLWSNSYDPSSLSGNGLNSIRQTPDSGYILVGGWGLYSTLDPNILLLKTNAQGQIEWTQIYGVEGMPEVARDVAVLEDGYLIVGYKSNTPNRYPISYYIRINERGDTLWTQTYDPGFSNWPMNVLRTPDGNITICGYSLPEYDTTNVMLTSLTPEGELLWRREYVTASDYWGQPLSFAIDRQGRYLIATCRSDSEMYLFRTMPDTTLDVVSEPLMLQTKDFQLFQNYPNPFNATTTISYTIPKPRYVDLNIYDVTGRLVCRLAGGHTGPPLQAREHSVVFDGSDLASGIYFVRLECGKGSQTRKMVLLK